MEVYKCCWKSSPTHCLAFERAAWYVRVKESENFVTFAKKRYAMDAARVGLAGAARTAEEAHQEAVRATGRLAEAVHFVWQPQPRRAGSRSFVGARLENGKRRERMADEPRGAEEKWVARCATVQLMAAAAAAAAQRHTAGDYTALAA